MESANNKNKQAPDSHNKNKNAVLDTSALVALFCDPKSEAEALEILESSCVSALSLAELLTQLDEAGGDLRLLLAELKKLDLDVRPFDEEQALLAAQLLLTEQGRGRSLTERAALALSLSTGLRLQAHEPHAY